MKILVFGATGMLGNAIFRFLSNDQNFDVCGTVRNENAFSYFSDEQSNRLIAGVDVENNDSVIRAFALAKPEVVINCVGLVKQHADTSNPLQAIPINTLFPHRLASLCQAIRARLVHISTDCVFSGASGNYIETEFPDAYDLYGRSKLLGEVNYPHSITLRTSIIGHELSGQRSLVSWFLAQENSTKGFTRAIFSGLPTVELAQVVRDEVLTRPELQGLYHLAAKPINKYDLLNLVATAYEKDIKIIPDESLVIDRSLNAERFKEATGYLVPEWPELVQRMCEFK